MVDLKGEWESEEVLVYTPTYESLDVRTQVLNYRHKLVEKFVHEIEAQTYVKVKSTRILHTMLDRTSGDITTQFEFTVTSMDSEEGSNRYSVWMQGRLDRIVVKLMEALEAESNLAKAQQEVTRNSFQ